MNDDSDRNAPASIPPPPAYVPTDMEILALYRQLPPDRKRLARELIRAAQQVGAASLAQLAAATVNVSPDVAADLIAEYLAAGGY